MLRPLDLEAIGQPRTSTYKDLQALQHEHLEERKSQSDLCKIAKILAKSPMRLAEIV